MSQQPNILGISAFYHDSSAAIIKGDDIIAAAQEERFTRIKFDNSFPQNAISYCLSSAGITQKDLSAVVFYEDPIIKLDRICESHIKHSKSFYKSFKKICTWMESKLDVGRMFYSEYLPHYPGKIYFSQHHRSHAAAAFYPSPFEEATILVIDGIGEWSSVTIGKGSDNNIDLLKEQRFPNSIGLLYSAITQYLGFKVNSGEYKVMGLAPYGENKYITDIYDNLVSIAEDGSLELNTDYFDFMAGDQMINNSFQKVFNHPSRKKDEPLTQFHMDIAKSIQSILEEAVNKMAAFAINLTNIRNLVMAGGVALNCVANGKLLRSGLIDNLWIQPCAGDGGSALGAAMHAAYNEFDILRKCDKTDKQKSSLLGPSFSNEQIQNTLDVLAFNYVKIDNQNELIEETAKILENGQVIGLFQDRMEYGPRALGSRSIIANAQNQAMQKNLNLKIKFRESFRPFAPIVLQEFAHEWFDDVTNSPYMLLTTQVNDDKLLNLKDSDSNKFGIEQLNVVRSQIPAVTHVDNSARLQTVTKDNNPFVHELLTEFHKNTGCPVLVNTSFNIRGEPIVCTPYDALKCFMNTNMDYLILEHFILKKADQSDQLVDSSFLDMVNND
jgi:carbamoyltransferase